MTKPKLRNLKISTLISALFLAGFFIFDPQWLKVSHDLRQLFVLLRILGLICFGMLVLTGLGTLLLTKLDARYRDAFE